ncbi:MAG TPA: winged helix-turn-helix domain-containing protein [Candidatus Baltobacteraceae bacterium]|nr:winged helix-turn-helix domain-containing protein [Candidatus Baltobacteraceae bacterium]
MAEGVRLNDCTLYPQERIVRSGDNIVPVPPKAFDVLAALVERAGEVVAKDTLMDAAWGDSAVEESNLTQSIYQLRRVLRDWDPWVRIETIPRRGYRLLITGGQPVTVRPQQKPWKVAARFIVLVLVAALGIVWWRTSHRAPPVPQSYALGYYYWSNAKSVADNRKAIAYFERAIGEAPNNALGYAGLADAYLSLAIRRIGSPQMVVDARRAFQAARKAVALDDSSADAHAALGQANAVFGDPSIAERELKRAVELDPQLTEAHTWYGELLMGEARVGAAQGQFLDALALNTSWTQAGDDLALLAYLQRDYARARAYAEQSLAQSPADFGAQFTLALAEGRHDRASAKQLLMALARGHPNDVAVQGLLSYFDSEDRDSLHAVSHLTRAEQTVRKRGGVEDPSAIVSLAAALSGQHEYAVAFAWLSRLDGPTRKLFAGDARLDALRSDPAFRQWLRRMR